MKISLPHGSDFPYFKKINSIKKNKLGYKFKIILFSKTKEEKRYYQSLLKLRNNNFLRLGNPKHEKKWINILSPKKKIYYPPSKKYVFIISRPADRIYFTGKNKLQTLKIIKNIIKIFNL